MSLATRIEPLAPITHLNKAHLLHLVAGDLDLVQTLLTTYLKCSPGELAAFGQGITTGDATQTALYAHRLRGSLRYLGAKAIEQLLYEAEDAARVSDRSGLRSCHQRILPAMQQLEQEIQAWQQALCAP